MIHAPEICVSNLRILITWFPGLRPGIVWLSLRRVFVAGKRSDFPRILTKESLKINHKVSNCWNEESNNHNSDLLTVSCERLFCPWCKPLATIISSYNHFGAHSELSGWPPRVHPLLVFTDSGKHTFPEIRPISKGRPMSLVRRMKQPFHKSPSEVRRRGLHIRIFCDRQRITIMSYCT